jgi:hypothetical protein
MTNPQPVPTGLSGDGFVEVESIKVHTLPYQPNAELARRWLNAAVSHGHTVQIIGLAHEHDLLRDADGNQLFARCTVNDELYLLGRTMPTTLSAGQCQLFARRPRQGDPNRFEEPPQ